MKSVGILMAALLIGPAYAATPEPVIPLRQNLAVVEYSSAGRQTGCGLRATGITRQNLSLNVLITVFMKEAGVAFGVIKVVARTIELKDGVPHMPDGSDTGLNSGKIHRAWIKSESGKSPQLYQNGESAHNDAYMASAEFSSTVDLLLAISQENFRVGLSRSEFRLDGKPNQAEADTVFQFDQRISQDEAGKLSACMGNLRAAIEESKRKNIF